MQTSSTAREDSLPPNLGLWMNEVCDRFENAWSGHERPQLEDYLGHAPEPQRSHLLRELVLLDVHYRQHAGETPQASDYQPRFPTLELDWLGRLVVNAGGSSLPEGSTLEQPSIPLKAAEDASVSLPTIPGYEILGIVGRGGMGVIYKALHVQLNRIVALKMILSGEYASPDELARFRREAEAVARLQHPNIVQIHEVGEHQGRAYFALEYVDGGSLAGQLKGDPQPARIAAALVLTLARTIHYAHQRGIIHRDLKPANVLMQENNHETHEKEHKEQKTETESTSSSFSCVSCVSWFSPKITDFGLAKHLYCEDDYTRTGMLVGTPNYMAPEQAGSKLGQIGPATDTYALGVILYELLTGRPPFKSPDLLEMLEQVRTQEPVPPSRLRLGVPRDLETICLKALAKVPARRYTSAQDFADDLRRWLDGKPIRARPVTHLEHLWSWCRRNPLVAGLVGTVATLLVTVAVGATLAAFRLDAARGRAEQAERDGREKLRDSLLAQAQANRWSGQAGRRFASLQALLDAARVRPGPDLRNEAIACMALVDLRVHRMWEGWVPGTTVLTFDANLEQYARGDAQGNLSVRRVSDDEETVRLPGPGQPAWGLRFSPDGRYLAAKHHDPNSDEQNQLVHWDLSDGRKILELANTMYDAAVEFSPDSECLVVGQADGTLRFCESATGREIRRLPPACPRPYALRFHPEGRKLAIGSRALGRVQVRDVESGQVHLDLTVGQAVRGIDWHPDGTLLAGACNDALVRVWDAESGALRRTLEGHGHTATDVAFSHGGAWLASVGWDGTLRLWDVRSGKSLVAVPGVSTRGFMPLRFSRDDRLLAYNQAGSTVALWEVAAARECRRFPLEPGPDKRLWSTAVSPDGRLLALARTDGVRLYSLHAGKEIAWLPIQRTVSALFHPREPVLCTWGDRGLFRWPLLWTGDEADAGLRIGPPEDLGLGPTARPEWASLSDDGRLLALGDWPRNRIRVIDLPARRVLFEGEQPGPSRIALSPDGRWVASGTWNSPTSRVRIWEVPSGTHVRDLALPNGTHVAFSADSEWLATGHADEYRVWKVGTWQSERVASAEGTTEGSLTFSGDGRLLAIAPAPGVVRLLHGTTGKVLATFPGSSPQCFSRDGSLLVTSGEVWNLRLIRRQLAEMGLDWDQPLYPPARTTTAATPIHVEVLGAEPAR